MSEQPPQPPPPFDGFGFDYDPSRSFVVPEPPPLPPSAGLFSPSETTDLFGFLDNFNFDLDNLDMPVATGMDPRPGLLPHQENESPAFSPSVTLQSVLVQSMSASHQSQNFPQRPNREPPSHQPPAPAGTSSAVSERRGSTASTSPGPSEGISPSNTSSKGKALLTTPQKRLNHIMSEQKRRNAIRDGYVQLTTLLAPVGAPPGAGIPTRGRPKGSGARGGRGGGTPGFKGKSGILFRAVEYIHWLEEGREALQEEVAKVEAAAGIQHPASA